MFRVFLPFLCAPLSEADSGCPIWISWAVYMNNLLNFSLMFVKSLDISSFFPLPLMFLNFQSDKRTTFPLLCIYTVFISFVSCWNVNITWRRFYLLPYWFVKVWTSQPCFRLLLHPQGSEQRTALYRHWLLTACIDEKPKHKLASFGKNHSFEWKILAVQLFWIKLFLNVIFSSLWRSLKNGCLLVCHCLFHGLVSLHSLPCTVVPGVT